jgi:FAD:protein FMN transferase
MGTTWSAQVVMPPSRETENVRIGIQSELDLIVNQMSPWLESSDLSRFNASAAGTNHRLPDPFFEVLDCALTIARESKGAYDPTVGPLVDLWGFGPTPAIAEPPSDATLNAARAGMGWNRITVNKAAGTARQSGGASIDLCGIAKGYGVDRVAESLRRAGHRHFLIEVGGELRGEGMKPDGTPWWVSVERPVQTHGSPHDAPEMIVALHALSIATSGDYRRYFEHDGVRYAHTIDPRTGRPVVHDVASVTVLHETCMEADAWATALMVMGAEEGEVFAAERNLAALFIRRAAPGFIETLTPAFRDMLDETAA